MRGEPTEIETLSHCSPLRPSVRLDLPQLHDDLLGFTVCLILAISNPLLAAKAIPLERIAFQEARSSVRVFAE
jgi:hypothetical protein